MIKGLDNVDKLKRLEDLEKALLIERIITSSTFLDEFFDPLILPPNLSI